MIHNCKSSLNLTAEVFLIWADVCIPFLHSWLLFTIWRLYQMARVQTWQERTLCSFTAIKRACCKIVSLRVQQECSTCCGALLGMRALWVLLEFTSFFIVCMQRLAAVYSGSIMPHHVPNYLPLFVSLQHSEDMLFQVDSPQHLSKGMISGSMEQHFKLSLFKD